MLLFLLVLAILIGVGVYFGRGSPAGSPMFAPEPELEEGERVVDCRGDGYSWVKYGSSRSLKVKSFQGRRETFGAAKALCVAENATLWEVFGNAAEWVAVVDHLDSETVGIGETWLGAIPVAKACEGESAVDDASIPMACDL